jgi:hypothetical protein
VGDYLQGWFGGYLFWEHRFGNTAKISNLADLMVREALWRLACPLLASVAWTFFEPPFNH